MVLQAHSSVPTGPTGSWDYYTEAGGDSVSLGWHPRVIFQPCPVGTVHLGERVLLYGSHQWAEGQLQGPEQVLSPGALREGPVLGAPLAPSPPHGQMSWSQSG